MIVLMLLPFRCRFFNDFMAARLAISDNDVKSLYSKFKDVRVANDELGMVVSEDS